VIILIGLRPEQRVHRKKKVHQEKDRPLQSTHSMEPASIDVNVNSDGASRPRSYTNKYPGSNTTHHKLWTKHKTACKSTNRCNIKHVAG
jgi:hypothetical protein